MTAGPVHTGAWWLWGGGLAAAALSTTNLAVLVLVGFVVVVVALVRRGGGPEDANLAAFVRLGLVVVVLRVVLQVVFAPRTSGTVLFTLPSAQLPSWAAGVALGGPVTLEALVAALRSGMQLAVVLTTFGALNALTSPYRLLRLAPLALHEVGVAATVALSTAPRAVASARAVQQARRLRGRPTRGPAGLRHLSVPVLEGALARSVRLAASMDARGFGRHAAVAPTARRRADLALVAGTVAVAVGAYAVLDRTTSDLVGGSLVLGGAVALVASLRMLGRATVRTRYRPERWTTWSTFVAASGLLPLVAVWWTARAAPLVVDPPGSPVTWPPLTSALVVGVGTALLPSFGVASPVGGHR